MNSFSLHKNLWGKDYHCGHFTDEETDALAKYLSSNKNEHRFLIFWRIHN